MANGEKNGFLSIPETVTLMKWAIGVLITIIVALGSGYFGKQSIEADVRENTTKIHEQTIEYRHLSEDVGEIKQGMKAMNSEMKEQHNMIEEIHREVIRGQ